MAGWRRGWVVSVERGAGAELKTAHVQVIILRHFHVNKNLFGSVYL